MNYVIFCDNKKKTKKTTKKQAKVQKPNHLKNIYQIKNTTNNPTTATGAYCRINASKLILCAAFLYLTDSALNELDKSPILSNESPLYSKSSIFLDMIFLTSFNSLLILSKLDCARWSMYTFLVLLKKLSKLIYAYGRKPKLLTAS